MSEPDYEAKARELVSAHMEKAEGFCDPVEGMIAVVAAALAQATAEMRERCEDLVRHLGEEEIADAIAALKAAGEK